MEKLVILFLLFIIYSFLGWVMECTYEGIRNKKWINRGFLIGPCCPIYGVGVLLMIIFLRKYLDQPIILFIVSCVICSILEYFTSWIMEIIFKNRWWDYSDFKFNINGRICLETTIPFGIAGTFVSYILHPSIMFVVNKIPMMIIYILSIDFAIIFLIDLFISFDVIINLKNVSKNIKTDSTEKITKKAREILTKEGFLGRRLVQAFPKMKIRIPLLKRNKKTRKK